MHKTAPEDLILIHIQKANIKTKYHPPQLQYCEWKFHQTVVKLSAEGVEKRELSGIVA